MSNLDTTASDNQFYNELIDRFLNSKSYFYTCVSKFLENPSLLKIYADPSIIQLLSQLINSLINAKQPAGELKEITLVQGFGDVYSNLEMQLIRYDLRSLEQPQLKKAIQNIALNFVIDIYQVVQNNEKGQKTLKIYLELKAKLNNILNGSNGHRANRNAEEFQEQENFDPFNNNDEQISKFPLPDIGNGSSHSVEDDTSKGNINLLGNYFEKEVAQLLQPLDIYSNKIAELSTDSNFIRQLYQNFSRIQGLANHHGHEEVEVISSRVSQLMLTIVTTNDSINQQIIELVYKAKAAIEKMLVSNQTIGNLNELLRGLEYAITFFKTSDKTQTPQIGESGSIPDPDEQETFSFEINPSFNRVEETTLNNSQKRNASSIFSGFQSEKIFRENVDSIKLNSEDDEELLKLIQEVDLSKLSSLPGNASQLEDDNNGCSEEDNSIEEVNPNYSPHELDDLDTSTNDLFQVEDDGNGCSEGDSTDEEISPEHLLHELDDLDTSTNEFFQSEAELYYKILLRAISQLKNEEKIQTALEDIELASSSLKYLAQKFGMEKIALLPELMESISILANKHIIQIPSSILQGLEDGVILLKEFETNNTDHKAKFMSMLALLKDFYSTMLDKTTKILITSET